MPEAGSQFRNPYTHTCNKCNSKFRSYDTAVAHVLQYHPDHEGLLYSVKSKVSGGMGRVYDAEKAGYDSEGGKYVVTCDTHGTLINTDSLGDAKRTAAAPHNFCEECRGEY